MLTLLSVQKSCFALFHGLSFSSVLECSSLAMSIIVDAIYLWEWFSICCNCIFESSIEKQRDGSQTMRRHNSFNVVMIPVGSHIIRVTPVSDQNPSQSSV